MPVRQVYAETANWNIGFVYAQDGQEWADYLTKCLTSAIKTKSRLTSPPLCITHHKLNQINFDDLPLTTANTLTSATIFVILLTPHFLDYIDSNPKVYNLGCILEPGKTIAVLCGIRVEDISNCHKAALISFDSWPYLTAKDQDHQSAVAIIETICGILFSNPLKSFEFNSTLKASDNNNIDKTSNMLSNYHQMAASVSPQFKLSPRKVKEGSEKVYLLLSKPLKSKLDVARVFLEINVNRGTKEMREVNVKVLNPYVLQILIPEKFLQRTRIINVILLVDNKERHLLGSRPLKCESKMSELYTLLSSLDNPLQFLSQTFGLSTVDDLDKELADRFDRNCPASGFNIFENSEPRFGFFQSPDELQSDLEIPTLLHFSANYGLKQLTSKLLICPDAIIICFIKNSNGLNPLDLAIKNKHTEVTRILQQFIDSSNSDSRSSFKINLLYHQSDAIKAALIQEDQKKSNSEHSETEHCNDDFESESDQSPQQLFSVFNFDQNANMNLNSEPKITFDNLTEENIKCLIENIKLMKSNLNTSQIELIKILQSYESNCCSIEDFKKLLDQWRCKYYDSSPLSFGYQFDFKSFLNGTNDLNTMSSKASIIQHSKNNIQSSLSTSNLISDCNGRLNFQSNKSFPLLNEPKINKNGCKLKNPFPTHDYVNEKLSKINSSESETSNYSYLYDHSSKNDTKNAIKHSNLESSENNSQYYSVRSLNSSDKIQSNIKSYQSGVNSIENQTFLNRLSAINFASKKSDQSGKASNHKSETQASYLTNEYDQVPSLPSLASGSMFKYNSEAKLFKELNYDIPRIFNPSEYD